MSVFKEWTDEYFKEVDHCCLGSAVFLVEDGIESGYFGVCFVGYCVNMFSEVEVVVKCHTKEFAFFCDFYVFVVECEFSDILGASAYSAKDQFACFFFI